MTYEEAAHAIRERFAQGMRTYRPDVDIQWPNAGERTRTGPWVALTIRPATGRQVEVGGTNRYTGTIIVQVFTPQGRGDGEAWEVADAVDNSLHQGRHNGVLYRTPYVDTVGGDGQGWYQMNVNVPFQFEHP